MNIDSSPPYEEVLKFLSTQKFYAEDLPDWSFSNDASETYELSFGLLDKHSLERTKFIVELLIQYSPKTKKRLFKFTLLKVEYKNKGTTRYYQLETKSFKNIKKSFGHNLPHEHIGRNPEGRVNGSLDWLDWDFEQAFSHFCSRVRIDFDKRPRAPETFEL